MEYGRTDKGNIFIYANVLDENNNKLDYILVKEKSKHFANSYTLEKKWLKDEKIVKHSKNIIDLIEVGDIVEIRKTYREEETILYHMIDDEYTKSFTRNLKTEYIVTILTKEQYNQNCYRLKE